MEIHYIRHQQQKSHSLDPPIIQKDDFEYLGSEGYDIIISSPYLRTRMTAEKIDSKKEISRVIIDYRICEYQGHKKNIKGSFDSKTKEYDPPIKENFEEFSKRVRDHLRCIEKIKNTYKLRDPKGNLKIKILVITHGIVVKHIREILLENKSLWKIKGTKNGDPKKYKRGRDVPFLEGIILY